MRGIKQVKMMFLCVLEKWDKVEIINQKNKKIARN